MTRAAFARSNQFRRAFWAPNAETRLQLSARRPSRALGRRRQCCCCRVRLAPPDSASRAISHSNLARWIISFKAAVAFSSRSHAPPNHPQPARRAPRGRLFGFGGESVGWRFLRATDSRAKPDRQLLIGGRVLFARPIAPALELRAANSAPKVRAKPNQDDLQ